MTFVKIDNSTLVVPRDVRLNVINGLNLLSTCREGLPASVTGLALALESKGTVDKKEFEKIKDFFRKVKEPEEKGETSFAWVRWQLWGGEAGKRWTER